MSDRPLKPLATGILTFVITDMEGSTRLAQKLGIDYLDVLSAHRALLRKAWEGHGGIEQGTEGDSFFVVFEHPSRAIEAAVAAQRALDTHDWGSDWTVRVRMGIHTGEAQLVDGGYEGLAIHAASRIANAAHGGQILISDVTRQLAHDVDARDLGEHRLKDLVQPLRLHQVVAPELAREFPPPRTMSALPNNLPASMDKFIGRRTEFSVVASALQEARLITLVGPGGTGKTRLALEVAGGVVAQYPAGVWLVELATADDGDRVMPLVAGTLGLGERADEPIADTLERWTRSRCLLLVLDNAEHLLPAVASFADRFVRACPQLHVMVTSRELLGVRGERAVVVPPLSLPDKGDVVGASDALALFVVRAQTVAPDVDISAADRTVLTSSL